MKYTRNIKLVSNKPIPKIMGRGGYREFFANLLRKGGASAGRALGGVTGLPGAADALGELGGMAGGAISRIFGMGAYQVRGNTLMSNQVPMFISNGEYGVTISHREYLFDVHASDVFSHTTLALNPGIRGTFPWLSQLAANFSEYDLKGCVIEYIPTSGMIGANPALGSVIITSNPNLTEPPYDNKMEMESSQYCVTTVPYKAMIHPIECDPSFQLNRNKLIRSTTVSDDIHFYDWCNIQIATQGQPTGSTYTLGEIWISYNVELKRPKATFETSASCYWSTNQAIEDAIFANYMEQHGTATLPITWFALSAGLGTAFALPPRDGRYLVLVWAHTSAITPTTPIDFGLAVSPNPLISFTPFLDLLNPTPVNHYNSQGWNNGDGGVKACFAAGVVACAGTQAPNMTYADNLKRGISVTVATVTSEKDLSIVSVPPQRIDVMVMELSTDFLTPIEPAPTAGLADLIKHLIDARLHDNYSGRTTPEDVVLIQKELPKRK